MLEYFHRAPNPRMISTVRRRWPARVGGTQRQTDAQAWRCWCREVGWRSAPRSAP